VPARLPAELLAQGAGRRSAVAWGGRKVECTLRAFTCSVETVLEVIPAFTLESSERLPGHRQGRHDPRHRWAFMGLSAIDGVDADRMSTRLTLA
jgi:hypothetical protein